MSLAHPLTLVQRSQWAKGIAARYGTFGANTPLHQLADAAILHSAAARRLRPAEVPIPLGQNPRKRARILLAKSESNMADPQASKPVDVMKDILAAVQAGADHFGVLGLQRTAAPNEIRDAYFRLAKQVHPDLPQFIHDPKLRAEASKAFQAITAAHATLSDVGKRTTYLQQLAASVQQASEITAENKAIEALSKPDQAQPPVNADVAKIYLHRGRQMVQRRDWVGAQEALDLASKRLEGRELAECKVLLGQAIFNNNANAEKVRLEQPRDLWQSVLDDKSKPAEGFQAAAAYQLAVWNKLHGDMKTVMRLLDQCLGADPKHIDAAREKRLLEMRRGPSTASNPVAKEVSGKQDARRASSTKMPAVGAAALATKKVPLEKKPSFLERLFGKT